MTQHLELFKIQVLRSMLVHLDCDPLMFFHVAYLHKFKKPCPTTSDFEQYRLHATLDHAPYVWEYVQFLEAEQGASS